MSLTVCDDCGLVWNAAFDESLMDYSLEYDNSLHASAVFREFESALIADLVRRHGLDRSALVEIGGGSGRFLGLLCEASRSTGICFDPSAASSGATSGGGVELRPEYFTSSTVLAPFDLLCCRQVLEHVPDLHGFLAPIASTLAEHPRAGAYFDVPNSEMLFADLSIWDLVYEHCHYFVGQSLFALFDAAGLGISRSWTSFGDQFLSVELAPGGVRPAPNPPGQDLAAHLASVDAFAGHYAARRAEWLDRLDEERRRGRRIAVWGAGARAVSFFAMLGITDEVEFLVDANPNKQGTFLGGSGHAIHPPDRLRDDPVDLVVLLNGIYEREIRAQLADMNTETVVVVA